MMSKAKWFVVRKPSMGEIIAISANQIVLPKFLRHTKILASFPGPTQISVACSTEKWERAWYNLSRE